MNTVSTVLMNVAVVLPDAQPWDMYLFALLAAVVVLANRNGHPAPDQATTTKIRPGAHRVDRP